MIVHGAVCNLNYLVSLIVQLSFC